MEERSYGAVVLDESGAYLLIQHRNGAHWDFPKGHKEQGETGRQAALREVKEETGLVLSLIEGFKERSHYRPRPGVHKTVTFYLGRVQGTARVQKEEVIDHGFFSYEEAMERITHKESEEVLKKAEAFLRQEHLRA